jgi:hypothetical protein
VTPPESPEPRRRKLKVQGVKVSLLSASTITRLAQEHLRRHAAELPRQRRPLALCKTCELSTSEGALMRNGNL